MKKLIIVALLTAVATTVFVFTAFAGTWKQDAKGWWWDNGNGTWPAGAWQWCDGDGNGSAECYYFDKDGYCLVNTTTPDGYNVNENGAWTEDGVIQTKIVDAKTAPDTIASTGSTGSAVPASGLAVLAGKMNGTYKVTSTIPWESRWETLIISEPYDMSDSGSNYPYWLTLTSAKDGRGTPMMSKDGISYQDIGGQSFKDVYYLFEDPTLTFIDSNTFTLDIPDLRDEGYNFDAGKRYTVMFTWTRVQ